MAGSLVAADIILIPEIRLITTGLPAVIKARDAAGNLGSLVVGRRRRPAKRWSAGDARNERWRIPARRIGEIVAREIAQRTGKENALLWCGHLHARRRAHHRSIEFSAHDSE